MKKLLLTSAGFENPKIGEKFLELFSKPASEIKVLFIPTASRTEEELFYVEKSKQELLNLGILKNNIINFNLDKELSEEELNIFDSIYICGGNTFYLLHKLRESKFDEVIKKLVNNGIVYVGASAGSMVLGPDIGLTALPDTNDVNLKNTKGLNLVNVAISPHYCKEEEKMVRKWQKKIDSEISSLAYKILPLTDKQALLIIGNQETIIE